MFNKFFVKQVCTVIMFVFTINSCLVGVSADNGDVDVYTDNEETADMVLAEDIQQGDELNAVDIEDIAPISADEEINSDFGIGEGNSAEYEETADDENIQLFANAIQQTPISDSYEIFGFYKDMFDVYTSVAATNCPMSVLSKNRSIGGTKSWWNNGVTSIPSADLVINNVGRTDDGVDKSAVTGADNCMRMTVNPRYFADYLENNPPEKYKNNDCEAFAGAKSTIVYYNQALANANSWNFAYTSDYDLSQYVNSAYLYLDVYLPESSTDILDNLYAAFGDYADTSYYAPINDTRYANGSTLYENNMADRVSYCGIPLSKYIKAGEDTDNWVQLAIPLKDFAEPADDSWQFKMYNTVTRIKSGTDFSKLHSFNLLWVQGDTPTQSIQDKSYMVYADNIRISEIAVPEKLKVDDVGSDFAKLSWKLTDTAVKGYKIYRNNEEIAQVDGNTNSYNDTMLIDNETYEYTVKAFDDLNGISAQSNAVKAFISKVGRPIDFAFSLSDDEIAINLSWNKPLYGEYLKYHIYRKCRDYAGNEIAGEDFRLIADIDDPEILSYTDKENINTNNYYDYYIIAENPDGTISEKSLLEQIFASKIAPPRDVEYVYDSENNSVTLSWIPSKNAVKYNIYRNNKLICENVTEAYYTDTNIDYDTYYTYYARALTEDNYISDMSNILTVKFLNPEKKINYKYNFFEDDIGEGYTAENSGESQFQISDNAIQGKKSIMMEFNNSDNNEQTVMFKGNSVLNLNDLRLSGAMIGFSIYAQSPEMLDGVCFALKMKESFYYMSETREYFTYTKLPLKDYVHTYGEWIYVEIPLSDFSLIGEANTNREYVSRNFDFYNVVSLGFYALTSGTEKKGVFYADDIKLYDYNNPKVVGVFDMQGLPINDNGEIDTSTNRFEIKFDYDMSTSEFSSATVYITDDSDGKSVAVYGQYNSAERKYTMYLTEPLQPTKNYTLTVKDLKSVHLKNLASAYSIHIKTNTSAQKEIILPKRSLNMKSVSSDYGSQAMVTVNAEKINPVTYNVCGINLKLTFDSGMLSFSKVNADISEQLKKLGAAVSVSGNTVNITADIDSAKEGTLTDELFTLMFSPKSNGTSKVTLSGTVEICEKSSKSMAGILIDCADVSVVVTNLASTSPIKPVTGTGGGGGFGSGSGAQRPSVTVGQPENVQDSDDGQPSADKRAFKDIEEASWAKESVEYLLDKDIISGYDDNTFRPLNNVTRAEFIKILVSAFDLYNKDAEAEFDDVPKDDWAYKYIASAFEKGIVNGKSETVFAYGDTITREDMCTMVYRVITSKNIKLTQKFSQNKFEDNSSISEYAADAVKLLQQSGAINGMDNNEFVPHAAVNRAMAAKVIYSVIKNNIDTLTPATTGESHSKKNE